MDTGTISRRRETPVEVTALPNSPGVYLLRHRTTGDTYVGSSYNVRRRVANHFCRGSKLARRSQVNGADFTAELLEATRTEDCLSRERHWIRSLKPTLNIKLPADMKPPGEPTSPLNVGIDDDLMVLLKLANALTQKSIRQIAAEALDAWLRTHGFTPEKVARAKGK